MESSSQSTFAKQMDEDDSMMNYQLEKYYKALAEFKLEKIPNELAPWMMADEVGREHLQSLLDRVLNSLADNNDRSEDTYTAKFRHVTHLIFAQEKLEHEDKFRENVTAKYLGHRTGEGVSKKGKIYKKPYAVYTFKIPNLEDLALYQTITIQGEKGKITFINRERSTVEVAFEDQKGRIAFHENTNYIFDVAFNDIVHVAFLNSIWLLERGKGRLAAFPDAFGLMPKHEFDRQIEEYEWKLRNGELLNEFDDKQNKAIFSIVNGVHQTVPFILWGPPGTGKTVTIAECVRQLLQNSPQNRILICTPSNKAADLIARKILDKGILSPHQMRRYYSLGKNVDDRDKSLDNIVKFENCSFYGIYTDRFKLDDFLKMQSLRVVFTTLVCSQYIREEMPEDETDFFSHIFIDEAGQSLEPETLIPITRFATENTRIVLSGDHKQLGPVIKAHFLKRFKSAQMSMMERLMAEFSGRFYGDPQVYLDGRTYCQLTDSYRCHPDIIKFSSDNFYEGTLRAVMRSERSTFIGWEHLPNKNFPIIFHTVRKGAEVRQKEGRSFHNKEEAEVVLRYIDLLGAMRIPDEEIGVISPYKQQAQNLRVNLRGRNGITVDSVECYQGSERRVIILTLSRSNDIGFLSEYKRMNTSFTRAKELLIIVASFDFVKALRPNQKNKWPKFIDYCMFNNAVLLDKFACEVGEEELEGGAAEVRQALWKTTRMQQTTHERRQRPAEELVIVQKKRADPRGSQSPKEPNSSSSFVERTLDREMVQLYVDEDESNASCQSASANSSCGTSLTGTSSSDSDFNSPCSSDEEGQRFWSRQIPWEPKPPNKYAYVNCVLALPSRSETVPVQKRKLSGVESAADSSGLVAQMGAMRLTSTVHPEPAPQPAIMQCKSATSSDVPVEFVRDAPCYSAIRGPSTSQPSNKSFSAQTKASDPIEAEIATLATLCDDDDQMPTLDPSFKRLYSSREDNKNCAIM